jgi:hypothetical protein
MPTSTITPFLISETSFPSTETEALMTRCIVALFQSVGEHEHKPCEFSVVNQFLQSLL